MKKFKPYFFLLFLFLATLGGFFWWRVNSQPVSFKQEENQVFVIRKGESSSSIAQRLEEESLIRNSAAFEIFLFLKGSSDQIQAGTFHLNSALDLEGLVAILSHGTTDIWLTFPEGWRREEVGRRLDSNLEGFDYQEFLILTKEFEGYLFPDTYLLPKQAPPGKILELINKNFEKKFSQDLIGAALKKSLTKEQVLILASIVEREVRDETDRPLVAGILLKRWQNDWPLQADATVQYALANQRCLEAGLGCDWWQPVKKVDLQIDSLYNTYQFKGLPPAPICNPGLASIKAAIYPQESVYWFYLSDRQGKVHYSRTIEEHEEKIAHYLQ